MSLPARERKWRHGQAQHRIREGGRGRGEAGRPRGGPVGALAALPKEMAGGAGLPRAGLHVSVCVCAPECGLGPPGGHTEKVYGPSCPTGTVVGTGGI